MVHSLTYTDNIFDTFGVLSSFNFAETIWLKYEKFATPKLINATKELEKSLEQINDFTPKQAKKELKSLKQMIKILDKFRNKIEDVYDTDFVNFKNAAVEFFNIIDLLNINLQEISNIHSCYENSIPVLSNDWDDKKNKHWDNY